MKHKIAMIISVLLIVQSTVIYGVEVSKSTLEEIDNVLKINYYKELPEKYYKATTLEEKLESLDDPYTGYYTVEEAKQFFDSVNYSYVGIGVVIDTVEEGIILNKIFDDSPAEKAGLKAGDIITSVDGRELGVSPKTELAIDLVRGEEGTKVVLGILRSGKKLTYNVIRGQITLESIEYEMLDNKIGYIHINTFGETTAVDMEKAIKELEKAGVESYIIDVRYNGGGLLTTAQSIAGNFIDNKELIQVVRKDTPVQYLYGVDNDSNIKKPVILLVNEFSASASELLSASFKDHKVAYIMGETTFGKGVAQYFYPLSDGGRLKLSSFEFRSPLGNVVHKVGVVPDAKIDEKLNLKMAELLLNQPNTITKESYNDIIRVTSNGFVFDFDIEDTMKEDTFVSFVDYFEKLPKDARIEYGTYTGDMKNQQRSYTFTMITRTQATKAVKDVVLKRFADAGTMKNIATDKVFTITFNQNIATSQNIKDKIKVVHAKTGEYVETDVKIMKGKTIEVHPKVKYHKGETYYIIIHKGLTSDSEKTIEKGQVFTFTVKK